MAFFLSKIINAIGKPQKLQILWTLFFLYYYVMELNSGQNTWFKFAICIAIGLVFWLLAPLVDIDPKGWQVFSVFIAVIASLIIKPFPMSQCVLLGLIVLNITATLDIKESLSGFADTTVWLVIAAILIAEAVLKTGFGSRLALVLVSKLGKSMKGLAYAICTSEFLLGSVIPSNTARGGGVHAPIVDSLSKSIEDNTEHEMFAGRFLSLVGSHANLIAASMFMTGMAANPLVTAAAKDVFDIDFGWGTWLLGSIVPGICAMAMLPLVIYKLAPPTTNDGRAAQAKARSELKKRGAMSSSEKIMSVVLFGLLTLWSTQFLHGWSTVIIAWIGVAVLLLTNAQNWNDVMNCGRAWDTLFWLGGLLTMASMLSKYGFIDWFVGQAETMVSDISGLWIIIILGLVYFYSMYAFSMLSGHIAAMILPFFAVCLAVGAEPMITVAVFAYFSCVCGCTTNYSSGPVIIYYSLGYETSPRWFRTGFVVSLMHIVIWLGVGLVWWKVLGWW